jgi:uncharacterized protein (TIGR00369 family)
MTKSTKVPEALQEAIRRENLTGLREALEASPLARSLGIAYTEFEPGRAAARLPAGPTLPNFLGYVHTGAVFALAEQVMAAVANSLGYVGLPLNCEIHFLKGADPKAELVARARVVDTQGRIARVSVEVLQGEIEVAKLTEMVFLRSASAD